MECFVIPQGWREKALGCYANILYSLGILEEADPETFTRKVQPLFGFETRSRPSESRRKCVTSCYVSCDLISLSVIE